MIVKTEKIGGLSVWTDQNSMNGKTTVTVYCEYRPVVSFAPGKINERRLAVVQLVELGYCKNRIAGKICGFHRNRMEFKLYFRISSIPQGGYRGQK